MSVFPLDDQLCLASALAGLAENHWSWPRPSGADSAPTSDTSKTWTSKGPAMPVTQPPALTPGGLPEGRIPVAPKFTAMFIWSKTRGNKPRRRGNTRIDSEIIDVSKDGQDLHSC